MKELNDIVNAKLLEMQATGAVEKLINENVEKAISTAISDAFRSYGTIAKSIEEAFKTGFSLDPNAIDFESYNQVMLSAVKQRVLSAFGEDARSKFMSEMDALLAPAPAQISIDDFVRTITNFWLEDYCNEDYDEYARVELHDKDSGGSIKSASLKIWNSKSSRYSPSSAQLNLFIIEGKLRISHGMSYNPTCLTEAEAYIFKLYAAGTEITGIQDYNPNTHDYKIKHED